jgi:nuclear cap-binding protein subunit 2
LKKHKGEGSVLRLMAHLYTPVLVDLVSPWLKQRRRKYGEDKWNEMMDQLRTTTLIYVGNLSFFTREEQIDRFFSTIAPVKRIIMGLNRQTKTPCGFCFVDYYAHKDAVAAVHFLNGSKLDGRVVRIDLDPGFEEGRQYGRGLDGGQRRDDYREDFDYGRGGYGTFLQKVVSEQEVQKPNGDDENKEMTTNEDAAPQQPENTDVEMAEDHQQDDDEDREEDDRE